MNYNQRRRIKLKENGLCVSCGKNKSLPNRTRCEECKKKHHKNNNERTRTKREDRKSRGVCVYCGLDKPLDNSTLCKKCWDVRRIKENRYKENGVPRKRIAKLKEEKICVMCGKNPNNGSSFICETCRQNKNKTKRDLLASLKTQVLRGYGDRCNCCGETEVTMLQIDHVNNDGHEKRKLRNEAGITFYRRIIGLNFPCEYQLLCANCNWSKRFLGMCIHQIKTSVYEPFIFV